MSTIDFRQKFTAERLADKKPSKPVQSAADVKVLLRKFESDRGRIMNSAAVRRLQQKTQVFPLERNAAVRSRLTHSLEVQQTGRFIVRTLLDKLGNKAPKLGLGGDMAQAFETLVEMSCLMHDIGNPPFGHFGEAAIGKWFSNHIDELFENCDGTNDEILKADLVAFEGNAQAIRLTANLLQLNLTLAQTAGLLKYTRPAYEPKPKDNYRKKKPGFYYSEVDVIQRLQDRLAMLPGHRHPLAYIMEAADDISYCLADLEDAVEKGILSLDALCIHLQNTFNSQCQRFNLATEATLINTWKNPKAFADLLPTKHQADATTDPVGRFFIEFRVNLIHPLVEHAAEQAHQHIEGIYHGSLDRALLEDASVYQAVIETLKQVAIKHVFNTKEVETAELQGYRIMRGLLDFYAPLLKLPRHAFVDIVAGKGHQHVLEQRLFNRLADKHIAAYKLASQNTDDSHELYYRCRLLIDFVSGMTDQFAFDEYRTLAVI